jgi:hypothetical protein
MSAWSFFLPSAGKHVVPYLGEIVVIGAVGHVVPYKVLHPLPEILDDDGTTGPAENSDFDPCHLLLELL